MTSMIPGIPSYLVPGTPLSHSPNTSPNTTSMTLMTKEPGSHEVSIWVDDVMPTVVPSLRAHRPSTVRVPAPTCTVPKVSSAASQDRALALLSRPVPKASVPVPKASAVLVTGLPLSQALFRWGHLASRPVHPVSPLSGRSRTRPVSLAASSKARAMSLALVPRPPAGPPPDALLASRRAEPEPEDAEDF